MGKLSIRRLSLSRRQILILLLAGFLICLIISVFSLIRAISGQHLDKYLDFLVFLLLACVCLSVHTALTNRYRCPRCQTVFRPSFKREFLEGNFLIHRRLTCPTCGRFGLCHPVPLFEKVSDLVDQVPQGKPPEEERKWKLRRQSEAGNTPSAEENPEPLASETSSLPLSPSQSGKTQTAGSTETPPNESNPVSDPVSEDEIIGN